MVWFMLATVALAFGTAFAIDVRSQVQGLQPAGFQQQSTGDGAAFGLARRLIGFLALAFVLWLGVFSPLLSLLEPQVVDYSQVPISRLFLLHAIMVWCLLLWMALGCGSLTRAWDGGLLGSTEDFGRHLGMAKPEAGWVRELGLGVGLGLVIWLFVLVVVMLVGSVTFWLGGEDALPKAPPPMVPWIAGLPIVVRLGISLSAGLVEEVFFRGFLQRRLGLLAASLLFVMAHVNYGQPLVLLGITVLSFLFAALTERRGTVWAAVAAHTTFDAVQLLVLIPIVLRAASTSGGAP